MDDLLPASVRLTSRVADGLERSTGVGRVAEGNERYFALRRMGADWVGNPDLEPSRNTGVDLSVTARRGSASITADGFVNRAIEHDLVAGADPEQPARQAHRPAREGTTSPFATSLAFIRSPAS